MYIGGVVPGEPLRKEGLNQNVLVVEEKHDERQSSMPLSCSPLSSASCSDVVLDWGGVGACQRSSSRPRVGIAAQRVAVAARRRRPGKSRR